MKPSDYPVHPHRGQRFYVSQYDARKWCVCGGNGELLATCCREDVAEMIAKALRDAASMEVAYDRVSTADPVATDADPSG